MSAPGPTDQTFTETCSNGCLSGGLFAGVLVAVVVVTNAVSISLTWYLLKRRGRKSNTKDQRTDNLSGNPNNASGGRDQRYVPSPHPTVQENQENYHTNGREIPLTGAELPPRPVNDFDSDFSTDDEEHEREGFSNYDIPERIENVRTDAQYPAEVKSQLYLKRINRLKKRLIS